MAKKVLKSLLKKREKRRIKREFKIKLKIWKESVILRDNNKCQRCGKNLTNELKHVHHIIALQSVIRHYSELFEDINNGILLCAYNHKFDCQGPHQGGFEFTQWLNRNKSEQFNYLIKYLNKEL